MSNGESGRNSSSTVRTVLIVIQVIMMVLVAILGLAFVMDIFGANPDTGFSSWTYARTETLMVPFNGIFDPIDFSDGTSIQTSLLFAMLVYAIIAGILQKVTQRI